MYPHHLHPNVCVVFRILFCLANFSPLDMPDDVRVTQAGTLPPASFGMTSVWTDSTSRWTPLLLANGWQLQTPITDLHRRVICHARHPK
ncbi:MAG: hypothetical protein M3512_09990, partial [Bacteroidota bacterium]|nr:hypothetical protein [Bacteroidota bacterium]